MCRVHWHYGLTNAAKEAVMKKQQQESQESLESLQMKYADAITYAESLPLASSARQDAMREVGRLSQRISDWHERANPTPFA
jgi:transposase